MEEQEERYQIVRDVVYKDTGGFQAKVDVSINERSEPATRPYRHRELAEANSEMRMRLRASLDLKAGRLGMIDLK